MTSSLFSTRVISLAIRTAITLSFAGFVAVTAPATIASAQVQKFDLLLKGGHVMDAKNRISAVRDVAVRDGRIAAVAAAIDPNSALKVVDVSGLHVTPGLVDIHFHAYAGGMYPRGVYPDGFTFRTGVTTVADAGSAGWRTFDDFKTRIIDRSRTRVLAFLNIVGYGIAGDKYENDHPQGRHDRVRPQWPRIARVERRG